MRGWDMLAADGPRARTKARTSNPTKVAEANGRVEYHLGVKDMPREMRPRERLQQFGASNLSDAELLAIILGSGTQGLNVIEASTELLARRGGLGGIDRASLVELQVVKGIGEARATEVKAALELGRRVVTLNPGQRSKISSPQDIYNLVWGDMSFFEQEHLRVLLLDTKNRVLGAPDLYVGSVNSTTVRVAELFKEAIRQNATAIVLVHNHPSGDPTPSPEDVRLTRDAVDAGRLLDVEVLDHVVIGRGAGQPWVSLRERGLGFGPPLTPRSSLPTGEGEVRMRR